MPISGHTLSRDSARKVPSAEQRGGLPPTGGGGSMWQVPRSLLPPGGTTGNERASPGGTGDRAMGEAGAGVRRGGAPPRRGAVYVDDAIWEWRGLRWAHLLADDTDDLHRFAAALGIHRTSYQGPPRTSVPHYDRVRAAARARSWRDCLQPRRDRRGRASDAVVLRGVRSRSRLLTHDRD